MGRRFNSRLSIKSLAVGGMLNTNTSPFIYFQLHIVVAGTHTHTHTHTHIRTHALTESISYTSKGTHTHTRTHALTESISYTSKGMYQTMNLCVLRKLLF